MTHSQSTVVLSLLGFALTVQALSQAWNGYLLHDCIYKNKSIMYKDTKQSSFVIKTTYEMKALRSTFLNAENSQFISAQELHL